MGDYPLFTAGAFFHEIRVVVFSVEAAAGSNVGEGVVHDAAIASAVVGCVAVDELLLRECCEVSCNDLVDSLDCCYCRECPAATCIHPFHILVTI